MPFVNLSSIQKNMLNILSSFVVFNHEKDLEKSPNKPELYEKIRTRYNRILGELKQLSDTEVLTAYEADTLYDALKMVFEALGKKNKATEEVANIMGGQILEFRADKWYNEGRAEGRTEGRAEGEQMLVRLMQALIADGESDKLSRVASDEKYRAELYEKYALV